jgi:hypothetical protein
MKSRVFYDSVDVVVILVVSFVIGFAAYQVGWQNGESQARATVEQVEQVEQPAPMPARRSLVR